MTPSLPARDPGGHKGTFGTVAVVGGSAHAVGPKPTDGLHMLGGPCFAATAALRSGAGLARLVLPEPLVDAGLAIAPSATGIALAVDERGDIVGHEAARVLDRVVAEADCLVVGPGLGTRDGACACVVRAVQQERIPVVIDADALNCLALVPEVQRDFHAAAVLTPHPGEFARLAQVLGIEADATDASQRARGAEELAQRLGCVVVLKAAATIVSDGHRTWEHDRPNAALGTAGTGDVLAGVIGGLLAQHYRRPIVAGERSVPSEGLGGIALFDAACAGVAAHADAAARWATQAGASGGMLASDLLDGIPQSIEALRTG